MGVLLILGFGVVFFRRLFQIDSMWLDGIVAIGLAGLGFWLFRVAIVKPVRALTERAQAVLEGDLTQEIAVRGIGEIGVLGSTVNGMTESLRNLAIKIKEDTRGLNEAAKLLSEATSQSEKAIQSLAASLEQASAATEEQSSNTQELQAAFEEMGAAIEEISASAAQASEVANRAIQTSQNGVDAVDRVVEGVEALKEKAQSLHQIITDLDESAQRIAEVVGLITHMAEQTNLLALNAAIEAARAGDHGRGFAVVAEEVRKLAEESAASAQRIVKIVETNQEHVKESVRILQQVQNEHHSMQTLALQAKDALAAILRSSREIDQNSSNIAAAIEQQTTTVQAMNKSLESIAGAAQQIANSAQEASASIEEQTATASTLNGSAVRLQRLAEELERLVNTFRTDTR